MRCWTGMVRVNAAHDEYDRQKTGGLREEAGRMTVPTGKHGELSSRGNPDAAEADNRVADSSHTRSLSQGSGIETGSRRHIGLDSDDGTVVIVMRMMWAPNGVSLGSLRPGGDTELHYDRREVMQAKPMRAAELIEDSVKLDGMHSAKDQFKMMPRQADVETKV